MRISSFEIFKTLLLKKSKNLEKTDKAKCHRRQSHPFTFMKNYKYIINNISL